MKSKVTKIKTSLLILLSGLFFSGCAVGPLVVHETARSVGKSNDELIGGYGSAGYVIKWNHGLSENLDFGLQLEQLSIGLRFKYALINNTAKGWSLALAAGIGSSVGGSHYYADILTSYLKKPWEPYAAIRVVRVKTDPVEFKDEDMVNVDFTIDSYRYTYGQYIVGLRYWMSPSWLLSLEGSSLVNISEVHFADNVLIGLALGYKF